jgi:hypothetical protein
VTLRWRDVAAMERGRLRKTSEQQFRGRVAGIDDLRSGLFNVVAPFTTARLTWGIEFVDHRVQTSG